MSELPNSDTRKGVHFCYKIAHFRGFHNKEHPRKWAEKKISQIFIWTDLEDNKM